jgi:hypothetical protein
MEAHNGGTEVTMEAWRLIMVTLGDSHLFDEEQDPDPDYSEKLDPDPLF